MPPETAGAARVAYVMKMYPRFSETFIVNEILAHEAAGLAVELFSLRPPSDGRFHEALAEVRGSVTYLSSGRVRASDLWALLCEAAGEMPWLWEAMDELVHVDVGDAVQAIELARAVREREITHIHAHFASVATTVARLASLLTGVPYSFTAHAKDIFHDSVRHDDLYAKLRDARTAVTVSDFNRAHLRDAYRPAAGAVERIYNGIDLTRFPYDAPAHRAPALVAVGRLVEKKGFEDLIDACALLAQEGRELACRIVGGGPLEAALAERVAARGLGSVVRLMGPLPQGRMRRVVQGSAAMAAPCVVGADGNRDGMPTVLVEAMALGTPVVATDIVGIPELVRHDETGLLVPEARPDRLAAALARLLDDAALRLRLAGAARELVESELDVTRQCARLRATAFGLPAATDAPPAPETSHRVVVAA